MKFNTFSAGSLGCAVYALAGLLMIMSGCDKTLEYNSNSGIDGTRDSAQQLLLAKNYIDDISSPTADNEDWYYFTPTQTGFIHAKINIDNPKNIIATVSLHDGFGAKISTFTTNHNENVYEFPKFEVKPERYFISIVTSEGESAYTLRADFELPPPIEIVPEPEPEPECKYGVDKNGKCKPKPRVSSGKKTETVQEPDEPVQTIEALITLVTPIDSGTCDIKINKGTRKGVKPGLRATLKGLNKKVTINTCLGGSCMATVSATSAELDKYHYVTVVVE